MSKNATAAQRRRMGKIAELGCVICKGPASIHHVGAHMGGGRNHDKVIPLCGSHHQTGGEGVALHHNRKAWEAVHGTEKYYLDLVNLMVD